MFIFLSGGREVADRNLMRRETIWFYLQMRKPGAAGLRV
jgi:hypothetical protein